MRCRFPLATQTIGKKDNCRKKDAERIIRLPRTQNAETIENVFENTVTSGAVGHLLGLKELVSFNGDSVRKLLCNAGTPLHRGNC